MPAVHPTALVGPNVRLAADVTVGPFAVLEGDIDLAAGCSVGPRCHFLGQVTVEANTRFGTGCVIGDRPQHLNYRDEPTGVHIGPNNTFREHVTVHRAMPESGQPTRIGSDNLFMVNSHVAHDCVVGNHCIFANGAVIGGHAIVGDRVLLSGNSAVHQFCRVGRLALIGGTSAISQDLPPFWICQGGINMLHGVNVIGMRRAGLPREEVTAIRQAYRWLNRSGLTIPEALEQIESAYPNLPACQDLVAFVRTTERGICSGHQRSYDTSHDDS